MKAKDGEEERVGKKRKDRGIGRGEGRGDRGGRKREGEEETGNRKGIWRKRMNKGTFVTPRDSIKKNYSSHTTPYTSDMYAILGIQGFELKFQREICTVH